jgi:hypothetical protein
MVRLQPIVHPLAMTEAELVLNSYQDLAQNFGRAIGTLSSKTTTNSTYSQGETKGTMPLSDGSLAASTLSIRSKTSRNTSKTRSLTS